MKFCCYSVFQLISRKEINLDQIVELTQWTSQCIGSARQHNCILLNQNKEDGAYFCDTRGWHLISSWCYDSKTWCNMNVMTWHDIKWHNIIWRTSLSVSLLVRFSDTSSVQNVTQIFKVRADLLIFVLKSGDVNKISCLPYSHWKKGNRKRFQPSELNMSVILNN